MTRDRVPIEDVFVKATRVQALSLGLAYFLGETFGSRGDKNEDEGEDEDENGDRGGRGSS